MKKSEIINYEWKNQSPKIKIWMEKLGFKNQKPKILNFECINQVLKTIN
jgi:hypothetical protein